MAEAKVNVAKLNPVGDWEGGPLRVYRRPAKSTRLEPPEEYAPYGLGFAIPRSVTWPEPNGVRLRLELVEGALRVVGVEVGELPTDHLTTRGRQLAVENDRLTGSSRARTYEQLAWLSTAYLRSLPIDKISKQAAMEFIVRLYRRPGGEVIGIPAHVVHSDDLEVERQLIHETEQRLSAGKRGGGRKPVPLERLMRAAEITRQAEHVGKSPDRQIQLRMHVAESTAKKYLRLARKAGLLPPSTRKG
jgi:hypothetical protein